MRLRLSIQLQASLIGLVRAGVIKDFKNEFHWQHECAFN